MWPPVGIEPLNPFACPLLNTGVLLASGACVTWAHYAILDGDLDRALHGLVITILLGVYFTRLQLGEYWAAPFTITDGVYGSTFYVATGFHGLHVIIGTIFLRVGLFRL